MKTFITDIIPKIQKFSKKLDDLTLLTNQPWVVIDEIEYSKNVYIFRSNNDLLISQNGKVEKARWEYLGNSYLLIDRKNESMLFKHGFFDENILALKIDSKEEYAFLVNESKHTGELNSFENIVNFLTTKYIRNDVKSSLKEKMNYLDFKDETNIEYKIPQKADYKYKKTLVCSKYTFIVYQKQLNFDIGDLVTFEDDTTPPNGIYRVNFFLKIEVTAGIITAIK